MHRNESNNPDRMALHRIVALLLALADLADRASRRSRAVRCAVLWLLRSAEPIARDYVAAITRDPCLAIQPTPIAVRSASDSPSDAARLARSFRALASALCTFADEVLASPQLHLAYARLALLARYAAGVPCARPDRMWSPERRDSS